MEVPISEQIITDRPKDYDREEGEKLASWVFSLLEHAAQARKKNTREEHWESDRKFIRGNQWEGPLPSYRRPIVMNAWRRTLHVAFATILGHRPILKLVPEGDIDPKALKVWQDAFWALQKKERVIDKYADALYWAWLEDGAWFKFGYGKRDPYSQLPDDVLITSPHPGKVFPDPDCTDRTIADCAYVLYRDTLDLGAISRRYPENAKHVQPETGVSLKWPGEGAPDWVRGGVQTIAPAGGWQMNGEFRRACAQVVECYIDDPALESRKTKEIVNLQKMIDNWFAFFKLHKGKLEDPDVQQLFERMGKVKKETRVDEVNDIRQRIQGVNGGIDDIAPEIREETEYRPLYPYGRLITCTQDTVLRDIPNDAFGKAFGHEMRWPFVYFPGAMEPHTLFRPGLLADQGELQRSVNKTLSVLVENLIKATNAMVIADENAMDEDDWDLLSLVPGVKIRKRAMTEFKVQFPDPLPEHAFRAPDFFIKKVEEGIGLHDPPISPGQAVAAKTVSFLQQKGSFMTGLMAYMGEGALELAGMRIAGLMSSRYLPGRRVPMFEGETIKGMQQLPEIPGSLRFRVEATSALVEIMATMEAVTGAESKMRTRNKK